MSNPSKSEHTKKLEGHPNQARIRSNPKPDGTPRMPKQLGKYAKALWNRIVPDLIKTGVVSHIDQPQLADLVRWYDDYRTLDDAWRVAIKEGEEGGALFRQKNTAFANYQKLCDKFGTNPLGRNGIDVAPKTDDDLDNLMG